MLMKLAAILKAYTRHSSANTFSRKATHLVNMSIQSRQISFADESSVVLS